MFCWPATTVSLQLLLLLLFIILSLLTTCATSAGVRRLQCLSCVRMEGDTTMLDQFRVRHGLPMPQCDMEPVECDAHQDTCVTITMQITHRQFWIGSGCDQRVNYDFPSGGRDGCVEMPAVYRNFHPGFMEERRTLQRVCLCSGHLCNSATAPGLHHRPSFLPVLIIFGVLLALCVPCFVCNCNRALTRRWQRAGGEGEGS